jgi:hypothetical protein
MTEIGQIKKEKAIFNTSLMGIPRDGQERGAPAGRDDALTFVFYNELNCLNKQVKPLFVGREITEAKMQRRSVW